MTTFKSRCFTLFLSLNLLGTQFARSSMLPVGYVVEKITRSSGSVVGGLNLL